MIDDANVSEGLRRRWHARHAAEQSLAAANAEAARCRRALREAQRDFDRYLSSSFDEALPLFEAADDTPPRPTVTPTGTQPFQPGDRVRLRLDDVEPIELGTVRSISSLVGGKFAVHVEWDDLAKTTEDPDELILADLSAEVRLPVSPLHVPANEVPSGKDWCTWEGGIYGLYAVARTWTEDQLAEALGRFERLGLLAEADGIRGEQNRREKVAAGELEPKAEDLGRMPVGQICDLLHPEAKLKDAKPKRTRKPKAGVKVERVELANGPATIVSHPEAPTIGKPSLTAAVAWCQVGARVVDGLNPENLGTVVALRLPTSEQYAGGVMVEWDPEPGKKPPKKPLRTWCEPSGLKPEDTSPAATQEELDALKTELFAAEQQAVAESQTAFVGQCRVCNCTESNCQLCVERTGEPCGWVSDEKGDLCTACLPLIEVELMSLPEMPISAITARGRKPTPLEAAGLRCVGHVMGKNPTDLEALGLKPETAAGVVAEVDRWLKDMLSRTTEGALLMPDEPDLSDFNTAKPLRRESLLVDLFDDERDDALHALVERGVFMAGQLLDRVRWEKRGSFRDRLFRAVKKAVHGCGVTKAQVSVFVQDVGEALAGLHEQGEGE